MSSYLRAGCGYCSFFLVVQASVRFPNLPLVVSFWSATSFRSAKGRAVVVDPISEWFEIFLLREERRYSGPEDGAAKVLVVVEFVAWVGLFLFKLERFALLFHLFYVFEFGIGILVGRVWTGLGVYSDGLWVKGCLIDLCRESGGPITFDSRSRASFLTQVVLGCFSGSSDLSEVEWWANLIVWCNKLSSAAFFISFGAHGKLIVVDFSLGILVYFYFFFWCNTWDLIPYLYIIYFAIQKKNVIFLLVGCKNDVLGESSCKNISKKKRVTYTHSWPQFPSYDIWPSTTFPKGTKCTRH